MEDVQMLVDVDLYNDHMKTIYSSVARWTLISNGCAFDPHCGEKVKSENLNVTIRAII